MAAVAVAACGWDFAGVAVAAAWDFAGVAVAAAGCDFAGALVLGTVVLAFEATTAVVDLLALVTAVDWAPAATVFVVLEELLDVVDVVELFEVVAFDALAAFALGGAGAALGASALGASAFGASAFGASTFGASALAATPFGPSALGASALGASALGASAFGAWLWTGALAPLVCCGAGDSDRTLGSHDSGAKTIAIAANVAVLAYSHRRRRAEVHIAWSTADTRISQLPGPMSTCVAPLADTI